MPQRHTRWSHGPNQWPTCSAASIGGNCRETPATKLPLGWLWRFCSADWDSEGEERGRFFIPIQGFLDSAAPKSMARKRKSEATGLDEVDRTMYSTFCSAANSLSQLYTQAMNQQKLSFQAGERHALEKLYQWILRQHEEGSRVTAADIVSCIQTEIDYGGEDASMSPRLQFPQQHSQAATHFTNSGIQTSSGLGGQAAAGLAPRTGHSDQTKNSVFSNALSSPVRRSLQPYQLAQGGHRSHDLHSSSHNRESNSTSSNDSSMDMHSDSPPHESY